jgi:type III pantothenate kinase
MLLAVDIGNTNIALGIFKGKNLLKRYTLATKTKPYTLALKGIICRNKISNAIICSVVPKATAQIAKDITASLGKRPLIIGKDISVPVKNLYRKPKQVGQDRLVNAYAGIRLYRAPLVAVDFGTAITFDVVSKKGGYLGGMIIPGLGISLDALKRRTALLPAVKLKRPEEFIGKDTRNSMLSGIIYGFAALTDDLVMRIKNKIGRKAQIIGTGGNINLIKPYCRRIDKIDPDLTLKGLRLIYEEAACSR